MSRLKALLQKLKKRPFCTMVVVAAGSSTRAGRDKLFAPLGEMPVLAVTLSALERCACVDEIIVVTREDKLPQVSQLCGQYGIHKAKKILCGGPTRSVSALAGVSEADERATLIAIHDGARPLVTEALVEELLHDAILHKCAAPALPLRDTLKHVEGNRAQYTVPRGETMGVQTPQVFQAELIKAALTSAVEKQLPITDDCSAVEAMGFAVYMTPGSEENIKITMPVDFLLAEAILEARKSQ